MNAIVEVFVQFESFRNVDLFHQGIYYLRTSIILKQAT